MPQSPGQHCDSIEAADRWRDLYRAADSQQRVQNAVRRDHTKSADENVGQSVFATRRNSRWSCS